LITTTLIERRSRAGTALVPTRAKALVSHRPNLAVELERYRERDAELLKRGGASAVIPGDHGTGGPRRPPPRAEENFEKNGGHLEDRHVFTDDAISRAEFQKRPGLLALLNAAKRREIDAVVCRDETRLGGDTFRSGIVVQDLRSADVRLFYYASGEQVTLDSSTDKIMLGSAISPPSSSARRRPSARASTSS
jgi:hypothetical protein